MNWYKQNVKVASITFYPAGSEKMATPKTILDIAMDLFSFLDSEFKFWDGKHHYGYQTITSDGMDTYDKAVGPLNFYLSDPSMTIEDVRKGVKAYNESKVGEITIQVGNQQRSGARPVDVVRMFVVQNDTADYEKPPELNVANANAYRFLKMLQDRGLHVSPDDYSGTIDVDELEKALSIASSMPNLQQEYSVEPTEETSEGGAKMYDMGTSPEQYAHYLSTFEEMIAWIDKNNLPNRKIYYA